MLVSSSNSIFNVSEQSFISGVGVRGGGVPNMRCLGSRTNLPVPLENGDCTEKECKAARDQEAEPHTPAG